MESAGEVDLTINGQKQKVRLADYYNYDKAKGKPYGLGHDANHKLITEVGNRTFTLETGVYIPGWGSMRSEDTYRATENGAIRLIDETGIPVGDQKTSSPLSAAEKQAELVGLALKAVIPGVRIISGGIGTVNNIGNAGTTGKGLGGFSSPVFENVKIDKIKKAEFASRDLVNNTTITGYNIGKDYNINSSPVGDGKKQDELPTSKQDTMPLPPITGLNTFGSVVGGNLNVSSPMILSAGIGSQEINLPYNGKVIDFVTVSSPNAFAKTSTGVAPPALNTTNSLSEFGGINTRDIFGIVSSSAVNVASSAALDITKLAGAQGVTFENEGIGQDAISASGNISNMGKWLTRAIAKLGVVVRAGCQAARMDQRKCLR